MSERSERVFIAGSPRGGGESERIISTGSPRSGWELIGEPPGTQRDVHEAMVRR